MSILKWIVNGIVNGIESVLIWADPLFFCICEILAMVFFILFFCTHETSYRNKCMVAIISYLLYRAVVVCI